MDKKTEAMLQTLSIQRNNALDTIAVLQGEIADLNEQLRVANEPKPATN